MEWSNQIILNFLELYQTEPVIWNPKHNDHKDKKKVNDAWVRISESTGINIAELKKKKETLMATFRGHLRKKKASIRSGAGVDDMYKPIWFAYDVMEKFLHTIYDLNVTMDTESSTSTQNLSTEHDIEDTEVPSASLNDEEILSPAASSRSTTRRRRIMSPELINAEKQMNEAFKTLQSALKKPTPTEDDECDLYGKLVAKKMRKLNEFDREMFMLEVDQMYVNRFRHIIPSSYPNPNPPLRPSSDSSSQSQDFSPHLRCETMLSPQSGSSVVSPYYSDCSASNTDKTRGFRIKISSSCNLQDVHVSTLPLASTDKSVDGDARLVQTRPSPAEPLDESVKQA